MSLALELNLLDLFDELGRIVADTMAETGLNLGSSVKKARIVRSSGLPCGVENPQAHGGLDRPTKTKVRVYAGLWVIVTFKSLRSLPRIRCIVTLIPSS